MNFRVSRRTVLSAAIGALACPIAGWVAADEEAPAAPRARTRNGLVRGFVRNGASVFLGMPYGASTAGEQRFLAPVDPPSWSGERDATRFGQRAPQAATPEAAGLLPIYAYFTGGRYQELRTLGDSMGEDCLVLNVLTPGVDKAGRPVLVYIHGGGFVSGSGNVMTACDRLVVEQDVVVVTLNNRLGALGFLYVGGLLTEASDGNPGMLDIVAALRWVRDNIGEFGGDPDKVTLFGESGGGAKIGLLNTMPQAKGLFRSSIVESGLFVEPPAPSDDAAVSVLRNLGLGRDGAGRLKAVPIDRLLAATGPGIATWPVADGRTLQSDPWRHAPRRMLRQPMIVGYCTDEATLFAMAELSRPLDWSAVEAKLSERFHQPIESIATMLKGYRAAYPSASPVDLYSRVLSDCSFGRDMAHLADLKAHHHARVYFYRMEYVPPALAYLRAFHTVELPLVGRMVADSSAELLSKQLGGAWAAFARTGDPNHAGLPRWEPRPENGAGVMLFGEVSRFGADPQAAARTALNGLVGDVGRTSLLYPTVPSNTPR
jgi:para-nitrobenzyl esterase